MDCVVSILVGHYNLYLLPGEFGIGTFWKFMQKLGLGLNSVDLFGLTKHILLDKSM